MKSENNEFSFSVSYDQSDDKMIISFENGDNAISIPTNAYLPLISVLVKAGMDFQGRKIVDLGMNEFFSYNGDDSYDK